MPYLEREITISGNKMMIDVPLMALGGLDIKLPEPSQQLLYIEIHIMSPADMASIMDELEYRGEAGGEGPGTEQPPPSGPTTPSERETTGEEGVEIPLTWIAAAGIVIIGAIIIILKFVGVGG